MSARSKARKRALDLIYASEMRNRSTDDALAELNDAGPVNEYTVALVEGVTEHRARLDEVISTYAQGWTLDRMPAVDRNVLRHGDLRGAVRRRGPDAVAVSEALQPGPRPLHRRVTGVRQRSSRQHRPRPRVAGRLSRGSGRMGAVTSDVEQAPVPHPPGLPAGWTARTPCSATSRSSSRCAAPTGSPYTGSASVDREADRVRGRRTRVLDATPAARDRPRRTVRARGSASTTAPTGRTMVRAVRRPLGRARRTQVAGALYAWAEEQAAEICIAARGRRRPGWTRARSPRTRSSSEWLADAGYTKRRTWPQMTRPVTPEEATSLPPPREGVTIRRVASHENGLPVAGDLHLVHEMLEASFEDHFNSYRESFPEFVQRLREDPGHRWDHWWLAFVEGEDGEQLAAGARGRHGAARERGRPRGQLRRVHRCAPARARSWRRQGAAARRDRRRGPARP